MKRNCKGNENVIRKREKENINNNNIYIVAFGNGSERKYKGNL